MCEINQLYADICTGDVYRIVCVAHGDVQGKPDLYILQGRIDSSFGLKRGCFYVTEEEIEDNYIILNNMFYEGE